MTGSFSRGVEIIFGTKERHISPSLLTFMTSPVLEIRDVSKHFGGGGYALRNVSLTVNQGETVVLIGESGSGKTTLLRLFNRLEIPSSGEILIQGKDISQENPILLRRRLGYVQQDGGLLPHWTVSRNVGLVPTLLKWNQVQRDERVDAMLELVNLDPGHYRNRYPSELSGRQRQRIAFARAMAADPAIVLLDEPFGALDAITRNELQQHFLHLKGQLRKTMVLVTHDLQEAFRLGDRVAVLRNGHLLQIGYPHDLLTHPADDYVKTLLDQGARGISSNE